MPLEHSAFLQQVEPFRRELKAHCYRMSGSLQDAEDLVQESLIKAWRGFDSFQGRSSLKRWLYSVATRVCLDALEAKKSRVLLTGAPADPSQPPGSPPADVAWLDPYPDDALPSVEVSPETKYSRAESVTLAFLSALQLLPARQRAVLLLRDVLGWQASECAELLEMTVAAVNSALQRARETLANEEPPPPPADDAPVRSLLEKYVKAWEQADIGALVALLQRDAIAAMPPLPLWLDGADAIGAFFGRWVMPLGKFTMKATRANGAPALLSSVNGEPAALHVLTVRDGRIARLDAFLNPALAQHFG
jgi:RNA polymerase sigma-70 factor (ECF subfamily)